MVTIDHILTNYVDVRKDYLLLDQTEKDQLVTKFMEIAPALHKEKPLELDSIDLFLCDQSPENMRKMGVKSINDPDWLEVIADCERFYIKSSRNLVGPEFIPYRSLFSELAEHHGYDFKWDGGGFRLYKKGMLHDVTFQFDRHAVTLQCEPYNHNKEELCILSALLASIKEMIIHENEQYKCYRLLFATGAYNIEVAISDVNK